MKKGGYITLLSVLIVGAVGAAISISVLLLGLGSARTSLVYQQMLQAKSLSGACIEEGLMQIRSLISYSGSGTLSFAMGSCTYAVNGSGDNRTVHATGTVGNVVRKARVTITAINPHLTISSWQEVP